MKSALLQERFAIPGHVSVQNIAPGYPVLEVRNPFATAKIAVHGAQVLSFQPKGEEDLLWVSRAAIYAEGKSVRGGIPICWPWFGVHLDKHRPSHGFVRHRFWELTATEQKSDGSTEVTFFLEDDEHTRSLWPHAFQLALQVSIGRNLSITLKMINSDSGPVEVTAALHSYFSVGDIAHTAVRGLDGADCIDALSNEQFRHAGDVRFDEEFDRIFLNASGDEFIEDESRQRTIAIHKKGSHSSVVWNPWVHKSSRMGDFEEGAYRQMVCVETGNVVTDVITLAPGESHSLGVNIGLLP
ncbi:D-hexose-6-phosphate mutarotase [Congregibacter sp.]|uniref:D-hexose-6-phosphate mutarotase n=1 Tax=Congregibacter sp. TaxID=2744308 RepID=UPI003F6AAF32